MMSFVRVFTAVLTIALGPVISDVTDASAQTTSSSQWSRIWDSERLDRPIAPLWTHETVEQEVQRIRRQAGDLVAVETMGRSLEGRALYHLQAGQGPFGVLLWSQMHGDEPSATPALFDLLEYLRRHQNEPAVARLLGALTIHIVPMLNADGAQRFERRNGQGIDVNRDALRLQTPEGQALKALRDRLNPRLGFNLHNQNWRTSVGKPPQPAAISLLAVAFDEARTENEGRRLAKRVCSVIRDAIEPLAEGRIGRYDDAFEVRAFGDNVTKWGTPVVLIEAGPWPGVDAESVLTRLNFVGIMSALEALASGSVEQADPARYEMLPINDSMLFHTLIVNATIAAGTGAAPFIGDVGIVASRRVTGTGAGRRVELAGEIEDVGDLRVFGALETIDATGKWLAPAPDGVKVGAEVALPVSKNRQGVILPGRRAHLMVLTPGTRPGRYRVERVIRFAEQ
ncbi:MAG: M14 family zinc carboxypeptidase [Vicinamibacterales bacterium]